MGGCVRFERLYAGSYSSYVGSYILCVGFYSRYGDCFRRGVGYFSLYVGCVGAMWAVTVSTWSVIGVMRAFIDAEWAVRALCGLLDSLWGLFQALGVLHRHYVGFYNLYMDS